MLPTSKHFVKWLTLSTMTNSLCALLVSTYARLCILVNGPGRGSISTARAPTMPFLLHESTHCCRNTSTCTTARHPRALDAISPSISANSSFFLNCEQFSSAALTTALAVLLSTLQSFEALNSLLVLNIASSIVTSEAYSALPAVSQACMTPMCVTVRFGNGELNSHLLSSVLAALKANTALKELTVSKPDCQNYEHF